MKNITTLRSIEDMSGFTEGPVFHIEMEQMGTAFLFYIEFNAQL